MPSVLLLASLALTLGADSTPAPLVAPVPAGAVAPGDTVRRRPRAVEYGDAYARRLTVHRRLSYAELPLFAGEYVLGDRLLNGEGGAAVKNAHVVTAGALGGLFAVNTVTGLWNLYDARRDPSGRTRRWVHTALMLGADAGFAATGVVAGSAGHSDSGADRHRRFALTSMGLATAGTAMMWLWRD